MARHGNVKGLRVGRRISRTLAHLDLLVTNHCIAPSRRRQIAIRIVLVKLFDVNVLHVRAEIGRAPGDAFVVSQHDAGRAWESDTRNVKPGCYKFRLIPDARRTRRYVWIVRQQRLAGSSALP